VVIAIALGLLSQPQPYSLYYDKLQTTMSVKW
jgi:hypothetical protein